MTMEMDTGIKCFTSLEPKIDQAIIKTKHWQAVKKSKEIKGQGLKDSEREVYKKSCMLYRCNMTRSIKILFYILVFLHRVH